MQAFTERIFDIIFHSVLRASRNNGYQRLYTCLFLSFYAAYNLVMMLAIRILNNNKIQVKPLVIIKLFL